MHCANPVFAPCKSGCPIHDGQTSLKNAAASLAVSLSLTWRQREVWLLPAMDCRREDDILGYNVHGYCCSKARTFHRPTGSVRCRRTMLDTNTASVEGWRKGAQDGIYEALGRPYHQRGSQGRRIQARNPSTQGLLGLCLS